MKLTTTIRKKPADHTIDVSTLETASITAEGDNYDTAYADLVSQTPDGWQMLGVH